MHTSMQKSAPSINDPRFTDFPLRVPFVPPAPSTPYELRLVRHGLMKQAERAAVNRVIMKTYNAGKGRSEVIDTWNLRFVTMLRSEPYYASQLAKQQTRQYSGFRNCSKSQFTRFDIVLSDPVENFETSAQIIQNVRDNLTKIIKERMIDKIGTWSDHLCAKLLGVNIKVMAACRLSEGVRDKITEALSKIGIEVKICNWRVFDKENFDPELRSLMAADLPLDGALRADFEMVLQHVQQIHAIGFTAEERRQFVLPPEDNTNCELPLDAEPLPATLEPGKIYMKNVPRSPKTGRPARWVSPAISIDTRPEDIDPTEWLEIVPIN